MGPIKGYGAIFVLIISDICVSPAFVNGVYVKFVIDRVTSTEGKVKIVFFHDRIIICRKFLFFRGDLNC